MTLKAPLSQRGFFCLPCKVGKPGLLKEEGATFHSAHPIFSLSTLHSDLSFLLHYYASLFAGNISAMVSLMEGKEIIKQLLRDFHTQRLPLVIPRVNAVCFNKMYSMHGVIEILPACGLSA